MDWIGFVGLLVNVKFRYWNFRWRFVGEVGRGWCQGAGTHPGHSTGVGSDDERERKEMGIGTDLLPLFS
jgi:hypothetical protein